MRTGRRRVENTARARVHLVAAGVSGRFFYFVARAGAEQVLCGHGHVLTDGGQGTAVDVVVGARARSTYGRSTGGVGGGVEVDVLHRVDVHRVGHHRAAYHRDAIAGFLAQAHAGRGVSIGLSLGGDRRAQAARTRDGARAQGVVALGLQAQATGYQVGLVAHIHMGLGIGAGLGCIAARSEQQACVDAGGIRHGAGGREGARRQFVAGGDLVVFAQGGFGTRVHGGRRVGSAGAQQQTTRASGGIGHSGVARAQSARTHVHAASADIGVGTGTGARQSDHISVGQRRANGHASRNRHAQRFGACLRVHIRVHIQCAAAGADEGVVTDRRERLGAVVDISQRARARQQATRGGHHVGSAASLRVAAHA